jgi:spore coat protein CotH
VNWQIPIEMHAKGENLRLFFNNPAFVEMYKQDGKRVYKKMYSPGNAIISLKMAPSIYILIARQGKVSEIRKFQITY